MFKTLVNAFKIKDVRHRILYVLLMLCVIRLGSQMPVPGVNTEYFSAYFANSTNDAFSFLNAFTGGGFDQFSIFALSITPYITSSIIIQLLTIAIPKLEEMQRDGEEGRKKMTAITRYVTVALALFESVALAVGFGRQGLLKEFNAVNVIVAVAVLTAGSAFLMWVGEQINDKGVGNGISMVLLINILSRIPQDMITLYETFVQGKNPCQSGFDLGDHHCGDCRCCCACSDSERRRAENSGTVFEKDGRKKDDWRSVLSYSAEGKYGRCYSDYLCLLDYVFPVDDPYFHGQERYRRMGRQDSGNAQFQ